MVDVWMLNQTAVAFQAHSLGGGGAREMEKFLYTRMAWFPLFEVYSLPVCCISAD